ncbi:hypothetical protein D3C73_1335230 [compost metagenome]
MVELVNLAVFFGGPRQEVGSTLQHGCSAYGDVAAFGGVPGDGHTIGELDPLGSPLGDGVVLEELGRHVGGPDVLAESIEVVLAGPAFELHDVAYAELRVRVPDV